MLLILNLAPSALAYHPHKPFRYRFALRESFRTKLFTNNQLLARNRASRDMTQVVKVQLAVEAEAEAETGRYRAQTDALAFYPP